MVIDTKEQLKMHKYYVEPKIVTELTRKTLVLVLAGGEGSPEEREARINSFDEWAMITDRTVFRRCAYILGFTVIGFATTALLSAAMIGFGNTLQRAFQRGTMETFLVEPVPWTTLPLAMNQWQVMNGSIYTFLQTEEFVRLDPATGNVTANAGLLSPLDKVKFLATKKIHKVVH